MTIKIITIAVILLLKISPSISFADDKADSLLLAKAKKRDSLMFRLFYRNQNYFTPEFREKMRNYEIRNELLKNIYTNNMINMLENEDTSIKTRRYFHKYFQNFINMGDTLELFEYKIDTCLKINNSLIYNYCISNYNHMFGGYDWKNSIFENGQVKRLTSIAVYDGRYPEGSIAIDTSEAKLNNVIFISGDYILLDNYFDYCQCKADSSEFVNYLYYKYHRFNDRYDNIHKIGKVTYKINSSFPYNDYRNDCDEIEEKFVKFVFVNNKWEDVNVYYPHEIE